MKTKNILILLLSLGISTAFMALPGDPLETLIQKLEAYHKRLPQFKIHAFFNQDKFVPGDTAYFKTLLLKEDMMPAEGPQIINVEMVNSSGIVKYSQQVKVVNGVGA